MSSVERRALVSNQPLSAGTPEPGPQRGGVSSGAGAPVPQPGDQETVPPQLSEGSQREGQSGRARRLWPETLLKVQLRQKHWQTHRVFLREYDKAAAKIDADLVGRGPLKAQFYRWLAGDVKTLPFPDHCRVLEQMLPGYTVEELFAPAEQSRAVQVGDRDRLRLVTAAGVPVGTRDSVVGSTGEQNRSSDPGVARQVDRIEPRDRAVGSAGESNESPDSAVGSRAALSQREKTAAIDERLRSLMSWIGDTAPIKERHQHARPVQRDRRTVDRRRSR
ncbi:hypothetical protein [Nocardia niigatensis]